jgi:hypothetical protein
MKKTLLISITVIVVLFGIILLNKYSNSKMPLSTRVEIAFDISDSCSDNSSNIICRVVLERQDGIVVLGIPGNRGEFLQVIDTKNKKITDSTGQEPHLVYGEVVVTAGFSGNMSELRILRSNSNAFEALTDSTLPIGETYDTGLRQEFGVDWDATTTQSKLVIGVYELDFINLQKNRSFKKLYQKEITL